MNNNQENRLNMMLAVTGYLPSKEAIYSKLPHFKEYFAGLKINLAAIQLSTPKQTRHKGVAKEKKAIRNRLIEMSEQCVLGLIPFFVSKENITYVEKVNAVNSKLKSASDLVLRDLAVQLYELASEFVGELAGYEITQAGQDSYKALIDAFGVYIPQPLIERKKGVSVTKELRTLFQNCDAQLKKVGILKTKEPTFYSEYMALRKVVGSRKSTLSLKGKAVDAQSGLALKGVEVAFTRVDENSGAAQRLASSTLPNQPDFKKKSAVKGGFRVKSLASGTYVLRVRKVGFAEQVLTVYVNANEQTLVNIALQKLV
jgi:hypothetical protein